MWQRLLAASKNSATHLWANVCIVAGGAMEALAQCGDDLMSLVGGLIDDPDLKAQLMATLKDIIPHAKWPLVLMAIMVVTKIARNRTLAR
jgi:hypothetical protein